MNAAEAVELLAMHAAAVEADRAAARDTTRVTIEAALDAHRRHDQACEAFRRRNYPRAGRVVAVFRDVFTVSPAGRKITLIYEAPDATFDTA